MTQPLTISSDDLLADVEHHFRVTAGPGAGKTYWLVKHIEQVARVSKRLTPCARIAVISYTNVAVREILLRLGTVADKVDVSTIHSFLYLNVVRPYLHLLKDADGHDLVAHHLVDTHDVHYPTFGKIDTWVRESGSPRIMADVPRGSLARLRQQLRSLTVRINDAGEPTLVPRSTEARDQSLAGLLTSEQLLAYKRQYWREGTIDHEDVLYFAYRILHEYPVLCRFLSDRFPYLFIDEFQDTLPVQAQLVRWLAEAGTIIGVIGDPEQAIFGFVDASPAYFRSFALDAHRTYTMNGNRRSTGAIVHILNRVRTDSLQQHHIRAADGTAPTVYAGSLSEALAHAKQSIPAGTPMFVLGRKHATVMQARLETAGYTSNPWDALHEAQEERGRLLQHVAVSLDLAQRRIFDVAVQRLVQGLSSRQGFRKPISYEGLVDMTLRRNVAIMVLEHLLRKHDELLGLTALDLYNIVLAHLPTCCKGMRLPASVRGKFHDAAAATQYHDLFHSLPTPDETRPIRTVHQSKGAEAPAVFVVLDDSQSDHILNPTANDEEQRITYVALSRAQDHLFVFCPVRDRLPEFAALGMTTHEIGAAPPPARRSLPS
jgi:DNA helicase II / ATP-dependent DNA helicase PcrA